MLSFTYSMAPPVRPSRSLDGLERVVPPHSPLPDFLNKPLPARPEEPESSAMWSDSSDSESTVDSIIPSEPRNSADSYPIFVSGSDDFDLADQAPSADHLTLPTPLPPLDKCTDAIDIVIDESTEPDSIASSLSDQPGRQHWTQNRTGANHYFREKKWDYFPELAPSSLTGRVSPNMSAQKPRKKGSALEIAKGKYRWHSLDRGGLGGVRDSIKTYVHRTLSRDGPAEHKPKDPAPPATAPMDHPLGDPSSILGPKGWEPQTQQSLAIDTDAAIRAVSVATSPSIDYDYTKKMFHLQTPVSPTFSNYQTSSPISSASPTTPRQKQLAVPLSPYQKHGPAIWESAKKPKRNVQSPRSSPCSEPSASSAPELSFTKTASSSPPLKQLQQNTRGVFMGAKKKIVESKEDRRREQLKAQIKLVGPVNPHTYARSDPWV